MVLEAGTATELIVLCSQIPWWKSVRDSYKELYSDNNNHLLTRELLFKNSNAIDKH
jgi:hypothetical protein